MASSARLVIRQILWGVSEHYGSALTMEPKILLEFIGHLDHDHLDHLITIVNALPNHPTSWGTSVDRLGLLLVYIVCQILDPQQKRTSFRWGFHYSPIYK